MIGPSPLSLYTRLPVFYGWIVVAVVFVTMGIAVNARTAFSLLFPPILDEFGWERPFVTCYLLERYRDGLPPVSGPRQANHDSRPAFHRSRNRVGSYLPGQDAIHFTRQRSTTPLNGLRAHVAASKFQPGTQ